MGKKRREKRSVVDVWRGARAAGGNSSGERRASAGKQRWIAPRRRFRRQEGCLTALKWSGGARPRPRATRPPHGNSRRSLRHPTRLNRRLTNHGSARLRHRQSPRPRRPAGRIARGEGCTHFRTLKSGSCRIFSHDPMPCFCTASRSACSSSSSQYPRKGIVLWLCRRTGPRSMHRRAGGLFGAIERFDRPCATVQASARRDRRRGLFPPFVRRSPRALELATPAKRPGA